MCTHEHQAEHLAGRSRCPRKSGPARLRSTAPPTTTSRNCRLTSSRCRHDQMRKAASSVSRWPGVRRDPHPQLPEREISRRCHLTGASRNRRPSTRSSMTPHLAGDVPALSLRAGPEARQAVRQQRALHSSAAARALRSRCCRDHRWSRRITHAPIGGSLRAGLASRGQASRVGGGRDRPHGSRVLKRCRGETRRLSPLVMIRGITDTSGLFRLSGV